MRFSRVVIFLLITCTLITTVIVAYYVQRYQQLKQSNISQTAREALNQLAYSEREFTSIQEQLFSVVDLLGHGQSTCDFALSPNETNRSQLENVFISVAKSQKWYNHIRFINPQGLELIRVDYSSATHQANSVKTLQSYQDSELFRYAQTLADDQVGSWSANRVVKIGETIQTVPSVRIVTPVGILGERYGYIMIDVDIWNLSNRLNYALEKDLRPKLVSDAGVYLTDQYADTHLTFAHEEFHSDNLAQHYPLSWDRIKRKGSGYLLEKKHLLVFTTVSLSDKQQLHLVINLTPEQLTKRVERDLNDLVKEGVFVFLIVLIFALPTVSMALHYHRRNIESKLARAALNGMSAVMISDKSHQVIMVNQEFEKITGLSSHWVLGRNALKVLLCHDGMDHVLNVLEKVAENHFWEGEIELVTTEHQTLTTIMRIQAIFEAGRVSYYITSLVDISERKALENKLRELSEKDSLTHLWNRRKFEQELQAQTQLVQRYPDSHDACLVLIDIDFFKRINDELGHDEGDRVIAKVAHILAQQLRATDFIARIGGEEFAVLMPHTDIEEAEAVVERLRVAVDIDQSLTVTISAGITDLTQDSTRSYKCADIALYESKTLGRNQVSLCRSSDEIA
ncbi:diguanylate cyclase [Vibrio fluvialis]|uniref:sensor domain-containing diguanylate cyclase n=1 Tax=Vibrio fluvialis TaxID=676 RepID=UPI00096B9ECF|nr:diguanylate cyclase [Vibrio fluvialis]